MTQMMKKTFQILCNWMIANVPHHFLTVFYRALRLSWHKLFFPGFTRRNERSSEYCTTLSCNTRWQLRSVSG
uniref:Uncharacterized protein n=1 Tax=Arundo donax TaxID=35708 RepID=A0A0A9DB52_ARUDO